MCGIIAAFGVNGMSRDELRRLGLRLSKLLRHRGPDASTLYMTEDGTSFLAHERLNIVDASDSGKCASWSDQSWRAGAARLLLSSLIHGQRPNYVQAAVLHQDGGR